MDFKSGVLPVNICKDQSTIKKQERTQEREVYKKVYNILMQILSLICDDVKNDPAIIRIRRRRRFAYKYFRRSDN